MTIEETMFDRYRIIPEKLIAYGFLKDGDRMVFSASLPEKDFRADLIYDGSLTGKIIDVTLDEEYIGYRLVNVSGFSAGIRNQYEALLKDIRDKCCRNEYYKTAQARRIAGFIFEQYEGQPEFLWPNIPTYGAFRRKGNKKWYAIMGSVPRYKLNPDSREPADVEVINVKVDSSRINDILAQKGYYPAFHMNKKCWVSIILDETLPDAEIQGRIAESFSAI